MASKIIQSDARIEDARGFAHLKYISDQPEMNEILTGILKVTEISIEPGMGFLPHTHKHIDLVTIPLQGSLERVNSNGENILIQPGTVNVIRAGNGISHYEYNSSKEHSCQCLELEFTNASNKRATSLLYETSRLDNCLKAIIRNKESKSPLSSGYDVYVGNFRKDQVYTYKKKKDTNVVVAYILQGKLEVGKEIMSERETLICDKDDYCRLTFKEDSFIVLAEIILPWNKSTLN
ncbi:pirin family protein [Altibacter sp. HG106]|uniref:pirin family protein n=1 Tax=Altibacter sp. HG106 TaxID=3023937 RepID=UPI0023509107|nr:pirin family protein [Altibacter sp. HG106]MDC7993571.1 pirin family protein [Altibacter sp. HG106]